MTIKITITFKVPEYKYNEYEKCLADFDSNLQYIGITDMDVKEHDNKLKRKDKTKWERKLFFRRKQANKKEGF